MKMTESEREEKINQIVQDADGCYDYKDFASDCVRQVVSQWTDEEINNWFGISVDNEESED
jgi:GTP cyclohydrolase FolE2